MELADAVYESDESFFAVIAAVFVFEMIDADFLSYLVFLFLWESI